MGQSCVIIEFMWVAQNEECPYTCFCFLSFICLKYSGGYARTNVIGFRTSFVIASVPSSIY